MQHVIVNKSSIHTPYSTLPKYIAHNSRLPGTNTEQQYLNLIKYSHVATCELHKEVICLIQLTNLQFLIGCIL